MDPIQLMARQYLWEAKAHLEERGKSYTQQRLYRVAMKLLVTELWNGTQEEHELRLETIRLINRRWAEFRARTGEAIETNPLHWPVPDTMVGLPALVVRGSAPPPPDPVPVRAYRDTGDGVAQVLLALDAGEARGLSGYAREVRAQQQLQFEQDLYTNMCCEARLAEATRQWAWQERRKRHEALHLLTELRRGRVTEMAFRFGIAIRGMEEAARFQKT